MEINNISTRLGQFFLKVFDASPLRHFLSPVADCEEASQPLLNEQELVDRQLEIEDLEHHVRLYWERSLPGRSTRGTQERYEAMARHYASELALLVPGLQHAMPFSRVRFHYLLLSRVLVYLPPFVPEVKRERRSRTQTQTGSPFT
ncbi:hypothetical protein QBC45DRAFT_432164 [Copromyces sp. CBS 386.78]|nr:hypothetical protein QBC45DRAFT_432164 [Copromyces sp. CBS 386.78]